MKEKVVRIIGLVLIIIGIGFLCTFGYVKYETYKKQQILKQAFEKDIANNTTNEANENNINNKSKNEEQNQTKNKALSNIKVLGLIEIPKINVSVAIGENITDNVLKYAVGHFPNSAMPGQNGNFSLAGHRNFTYAEYFKNLDKLKAGDKIIIKTKDANYTYIVTESFIVTPEDTQVLNKTKDATITLVTCTLGAKRRLIIKGKLEK